MGFYPQENNKIHYSDETDLEDEVAFFKKNQSVNNEYIVCAV